MPKKTRSPRTLLLAAIVVALLGANVWWFVLRQPAPPTPAFELGATGASTGRIEAADVALAPLFDPIHDRWTVNGAVITDLLSRVRRSEPADAQHSAGFVLLRIAEDADTEQVRRALLSLTRQHICMVALVDQSADRAAGGQFISTPIHRIVTVRDNDGDVVGCVRDERRAGA